MRKSQAKAHGGRSPGLCHSPETASADRQTHSAVMVTDPPSPPPQSDGATPVNRFDESIGNAASAPRAQRRNGLRRMRRYQSFPLQHRGGGG